MFLVPSLCAQRISLAGFVLRLTFLLRVPQHLPVLFNFMKEGNDKLAQLLQMWSCKLQSLQSTDSSLNWSTRDFLLGHSAVICIFQLLLCHISWEFILQVQ